MPTNCPISAFILPKDAEWLTIGKFEDKMNMRVFATCELGVDNIHLTADAIDLDVDEDGAFVQTTPNFGGNILSHIAIPVKRPQNVKNMIKSA